MKLKLLEEKLHTIFFFMSLQMESFLSFNSFPYINYVKYNNGIHISSHHQQQPNENKWNQYNNKIPFHINSGREFIICQIY